MQSYRLGIFDLDGTLVDSERVANRLFAEHLTMIGVAMSAEEAAARFTGLRMPDCYALVEKLYGVAVPEGFHERLQAETFARLRAELQPMPGAARMLADIRGTKVVASSSEPEKIRLSLQAVGLEGHFARLFSATAVAHGKPAPDLFLHAAAAMAVEPGHCFVVEDSEPGVEAGLAAGMDTFALVSDGSPDADARRDRFRLAGATPIRALSELPALICPPV